MRLTRSFLIAICLVVVLSIGGYVRASGELVTNQENQPGQVVTRRDGDALYLTTETVPGATPAATARDATRSGIFGRRSLIRFGIDIPRGFATDPGRLINAVLSFVMVIAVLLVFFYLVSAAFDWITSGGDKGKTDKARQKIMAAIVGLIVVSASFAILNLVVRFLGFANINDVLQNGRTINGDRNPVVAPGPTVATPSATPSSLLFATPQPSPSPSPSGNSIRSLFSL